MPRESRFDDDKLFSGFVLGAMIGGVVAFFRGPRIRLKPMLSGGDDEERPGSLEESIEEAKAVARRRRQER